jgi:hypothetical protein
MDHEIGDGLDIYLDAASKIVANENPREIGQCKRDR